MNARTEAVSAALFGAGLTALMVGYALAEPPHKPEDEPIYIPAVVE